VASFLKIINFSENLKASLKNSLVAFSGLQVELFYEKNEKTCDTVRFLAILVKVSIEHPHTTAGTGNQENKLVSASWEGTTDLRGMKHTLETNKTA
jgi:hypothetical protein